MLIELARLGEFEGEEPAAEAEVDAEDSERPVAEPSALAHLLVSKLAALSTKIASIH